LKQTLKIGAMLLAVAALVTTGIAVAQSNGNPSTLFAADESTATDDTVTLDEGVGADETPLRSRIFEWLAPLVEDDTITADQAAAVADTLADHLPHLRPGMARGVAVIQEAADFLQMTGRELMEALRNGTTLADLAGENTQALIDHLVGLVEAHLDQAVSDGRLTAEEKTERLAEAAERISDLVNGVLQGPPAGEGLEGPGFMGGHHHGGGPGSGPRQGETDSTGSGLTDLGA
jgi:hypothetical protein